MQSSMNMNQESSSESTITQISDQFFMNLKLNDDEKANQVHEFEEAKQFDEEIDENVEDEDVEEDEDDEDFSFSLAFDGVIDQSQITAEEAFSNGLIKPVFPFFNQDLLLQEGVNMEELIANNGNLANVKKVFVPATASTSGNDNIVAGPYCDWDKKSVETCKKSNSTGFSKIWRFKDFMHRSSSDGKDAFVFLNDASSAAAAAVVSRKKKEVPGSKVNGDGGKVKVVAGESKITVKGKKVVKSSKKAAPSPHEVYLRSKAKEEQRRRSYHSYRPEVVGLFTNISGGGLTRNVHPF